MNGTEHNEELNVLQGHHSPCARIMPSGKTCGKPGIELFGSIIPLCLEHRREWRQKVKTGGEVRMAEDAKASAPWMKVRSLNEILDGPAPPMLDVLERLLIEAERRVPPPSEMRLKIGPSVTLGIPEYREMQVKMHHLILQVGDLNRKNDDLRMKCDQYQDRCEYYHNKWRKWFREAAEANTLLRAWRRVALAFGALWLVWLAGCGILFIMGVFS